MKDCDKIHSSGLKLKEIWGFKFKDILRKRDKIFYLFEASLGYSYIFSCKRVFKIF